MKQNANMNDFFSQMNNEEPIRPIRFVNAAEWIKEETPPADQIIKDTFDAGDKVAIIGSSKLMKSFFLQQALLCFTMGKPFMH